MPAAHKLLKPESIVIAMVNLFLNKSRTYSGIKKWCFALYSPFK